MPVPHTGTVIFLVAVIHYRRHMSSLILLRTFQLLFEISLTLVAMTLDILTH